MDCSYFQINFLLPEYREEEALNKYSVLLRQRKYILCKKFLDKTKRKILSRSEKIERNQLTDMINVNLDARSSESTTEENSKRKKIDSLDDYIASLNIEEEVIFYLEFSQFLIFITMPRIWINLE